MCYYIELGGMQMNESQLRHSSEALRSILMGCLNNSTIKHSEQELMRASIHPLFVTQLCHLIPNADKNLLSMILTTLKNYMMARYNSPDNPLPPHQKDFLRNNIFILFYQIYPESAPIKIFKEIMSIVIMVDYPWPALADILHNDIRGSVVASVYFMRQLAKANEYTTADERRVFEQFIMEYLPQLEGIVGRIFENFNEQTAELLYESFKTFYSAFHIEIPNYLRDFNALDKWILFAQTILNVQSDPLSLKNQEMASRIYLKLFTLYANDSQDGKQFKGWAAIFRERYCQRLFQHVVNLIGERKGSEDLQTNLVNCLFTIVKRPELRPLFTNQHCEILFYKHCLPLCHTTPQEIALFRDDPVEYVHRGEDLSCSSLRRAVLDLAQISAEVLRFGEKSQLMRMVEYSAGILSSNTSEEEKDVVIRLLGKVYLQVLNNKYLKSIFQDLTLRYFIPLLASTNPIIVTLALELLSRYLPRGELDNQTVNKLMELIYDKITNGQFLVMRFNAISAFTALLNHRAALQAAAPHFNRILQIYVQMLNSFEHESMLGSLEFIVKNFSKEVAKFAPQLISHLVGLFSSLCKSTQQTEDEDQPDSNSPATAALSTITQLLNCALHAEVYHQVSVEIIQLFRGIFNQYDAYFDAILSLFNVLVHQAPSIFDFNYPYVACRKLLQGNNDLLGIAQLPHELAVQISKAEQADSQFQQDLVSILKNLIQKMPQDILKRYPYPSHPELILCLIENKRFSQQQVAQLNFSLFQQIWRPYIQSYAAIVYRVGSIFPIQNVRPLNGISLFPWLQQQPSPALVRLILIAVETEQQADYDIQEQNTAQLLQRYANEDDDEEDEFGEGSDLNYSYHYDSPFDCTKDKAMLVQTLKNMPNQAAQNLSQRLSNRHRKKLEVLFTQFS